MKKNSVWDHTTWLVCCVVEKCPQIQNDREIIIKKACAASAKNIHINETQVLRGYEAYMDGCFYIS